MKRCARQFAWVTAFLFISIAALTTSSNVFADPVPDSTDKSPNYTAARTALARGDCDVAVRHLNAYLSKHPDVKEKQRDFYLQIKVVIGQCMGTIRVSGVDDESVEIDPLPAHPPSDDYSVTAPGRNHDK